jgi:hypothetical protein
MAGPCCRIEIVNFLISVKPINDVSTGAKLASYDLLAKLPGRRKICNSPFFFTESTAFATMTIFQKRLGDICDIVYNDMAP